MSTPLIAPAVLGDLVKREFDPDYSRETVTLKAGIAYSLGAVLGRVTATSLYALSPATSTTGLEGAERTGKNTESQSRVRHFIDAFLTQM